MGKVAILVAGLALLAGAAWLVYDALRALDEAFNKPWPARPGRPEWEGTWAL